MELKQAIHKQTASHPTQNRTGIPIQMKQEFEQRSGLSFEDVRVHYHSDQPAKMDALAYTQGNQIYIGPGQEKTLRHELGHVVQQKQGLVRPTAYRSSVPLNDDPALEHAASASEFSAAPAAATFQPVVQRALIAPFSFDNDTSELDKLKSFQSLEQGIDLWFLTAYEYSKQNALLPDHKTIPVETLLQKLYSMREISENHLQIIQDTKEGPLVAGQTKKTTAIPLDERETLSMVTHGNDKGNIVIASLPDPQADLVPAKTVLFKIIQAMNQDTARFYPFFCFIGKSAKAQEIYKAKNSSSAIENAQGPSLLPPGNTTPYGHGYIYNYTAICSAIQKLKTTYASQVWQPIISEEGHFKTIGDVIKSGKFYYLKLFCTTDLDTKDPEMRRKLFLLALEEMKDVAFRMYDAFQEEIASQVDSNDLVDIGQIFQTNPPK